MKCKECCWFELQRTECGSFDPKTKTYHLIEVGICRKYPPQRFVFPDDGDTSCGWPTSRGSDWCGEWEESIPSTVIALENRIVQALKNRQATRDGEPIPLWKLRRTVNAKETELSMALERLVKQGSLEFILIPTKGRPFSGYKLT